MEACLANPDRFKDGPNGYLTLIQASFLSVRTGLPTGTSIPVVLSESNYSRPIPVPFFNPWLITSL
jgi:hypothetical protein